MGRLIKNIQLIKGRVSVFFFFHKNIFLLFTYLGIFILSQIIQTIHVYTHAFVERMNMKKYMLVNTSNLMNYQLMSIYFFNNKKQK